MLCLAIAILTGVWAVPGRSQTQSEAPARSSIEPADQWRADIRSTYPAVRAAADRKLVEAGPAAIRGLLPTLGVQRLRQRVLLIIMRMGPAATGELLKLMDEPEAAGLAVQALGETVRQDSSKYVPALAACVRSRPEFRHSCGRALVHACGLRAKGALSELSSLLAQTDPVVRSYAFLAAAQLGPSGAALLPQAVAALQDPASDVRVSAARSLGRFARPTAEVLDGLQTLAADPDVLVHQAASEALKSLAKGGRK
jgi:HEAT repeat protein